MNSIKESTDIIINFSSYMHNRPSSITSGIVPKQLKIAPLFRLLKSGEQDIKNKLQTCVFSY